ncbi:MAG: hypothetical protein WAR79_14920 [Melioribacteraceae bacterium]
MKLEIMEFENSPMSVSMDYKTKLLYSKVEFSDADFLALDNMLNNKFNFGDNFSISISNESEWLM